MLPVLIIDDNDAVCDALQVLFELHDIPVETAASPAEGLALVQRTRFGAVIQDMNFGGDQVSGEEGVRLFRGLRDWDPFLPILLITAWTSLETAVQLVKEGAHDYLGKPWDDVKLVAEVRQLLLERPGGEAESRAGGGNLCGLVYADARMAAVVETALSVAAADVPVLITGPNGSGKEMIAKIIQANSKRSGGPFVTVNAGALPPDLFESELFGVESGAYTGAQKRRIGRFEEAHGGTLFLDEIGNLPLQGQIKLLRVLQSGEFSRLGSNRVSTADVRVLSATNADLARAIDAGTFREDLYFRLNVVEIAVPPLAERRDDILPLARFFFDNLGEAAGKRLAPELERALLDYDWPGNVRELHNRLQRAALVSRGPSITTADLGLNPAAGSPTAPIDEEYLRIRKALEAADGNISRAAAVLGLSRQALYRRMEKYGIHWERRLRS